jgi:hypothetical protein
MRSHDYRYPHDRAHSHDGRRKHDGLMSRIRKSVRTVRARNDGKAVAINLDIEPIEKPGGDASDRSDR